MVNDKIKIEIEMRDSTALFAVKKMIGYRYLRGDNFSVDLTLADDENERTSLIFNTNLAGFEDVARIIDGIYELKLGKQEEEEETED